MRIVALLTVIVLAACGQSRGGTASVPSPTPSTAATSGAAPSAMPSSQPASDPRTQPPVASPTPQAAPAVSCIANVIPAYEAVIGDSEQWFLYDVSDPLHPRLVWRFANSIVHIVSCSWFV